jgi:hypothetical protein
MKLFRSAPVPGRSNADLSARLQLLQTVVIAVVLCCLSGCVSKSKAKIEAQQAYIAGQQSAMMTMQANKTMVQIRGNVKNTSIPWTEDLTVAKAIVAAEYQGAHDPKSILIVRNGSGTEIPASELLQGHDEPLLPGDIVEIK